MNLGDERSAPRADVLEFGCKIDTLGRSLPPIHSATLGVGEMATEAPPTPTAPRPIKVHIVPARS
ncbi:hypothetical protein NJ76_28940 [Rhodococcus sp. IITR03]|nr:hypothetical protein NJ76_28940 [Rhodococcus sp. IITR03]